MKIVIVTTMTFGNYELLLDVIQHEHRRTGQPTYPRTVTREPRVRHSSGRPRSLPRGRPSGPPRSV
jgi:hypothetical protein